MTTDITELAQSKSLRKKLNRRLNDAYGFQRTSGGKHTTISLSIAECKSVIAALDEHLALVEALEKAQKKIAFQQGEIKAILSSLESRTVKLPTTRLWAGVTECYEKSDVIAAILAAGVEVSDD